MKNKSALVDALCKEMEIRAQQTAHQQTTIKTLYFGGGTPSLLTEKELEKLFSTIRKHYSISPTAEITLEANPEDIQENKLKSWKLLGINRLSLGIQTFDDKRLTSINRAHNSSQAKNALESSLAFGFDNITADLIFGIPPFDIRRWEADLEELIHFNIPHVSIYGLTIEPNTAFGKWLKKGNLKETVEHKMEEAFRMTHHKLEKVGFTHYEVSNYALPGKESQHNSAYWGGKAYLGFGPGAHSFDGKNRSFNVSNNAKYMKGIAMGKLPSTIELLTEVDRMNEYLFTRLRTVKGVDLTEFNLVYQRDLLVDYPSQMTLLLEQQLIIIEDNNLTLTLEGMLLADEISLKLFYE